MIVAGGKSPALFFAELSSQPLDWSRVTVTLADERWVEPGDAASNARLVHEQLLRGPAAAALFLPLKTPAPTPAEAIVERSAALAPLLSASHLVVLGVGDDGHVASLFPQARGIEAALDPHAVPGLVAIDPPAAPHKRLSLNLAALLAAREVALLIQGAAKCAVLAQAAAPGSTLPLAELLRQRRDAIEIFWSP